MKGTVGRLSIAVVVLVICTIALLINFTSNDATGSVSRSQVSSYFTFSNFLLCVVDSCYFVAVWECGKNWMV